MGDKSGDKPRSPLGSWIKSKASSARARARETIDGAKARVRDAQDRRRDRRIDAESRAHAVRVARAIADADDGDDGTINAMETPRSRRERAPSRREALLEELNRDVVNVNRLRLLASDGGVPDDDGGRARALVWKLCLRYVPGTRAEWNAVERAKREEYGRFLEEFCSTSAEATDSEEDERANGMATTSARVAWIERHKGSELAEQIDRDVARVHPDMHFFNDEGDDGLAAKRKDEMRDALYVFAKLNPGVGYVQGMHEMLGCLYYVFATCSDEEQVANAAADAFYCFSEIFGEFRDVFVKELDATDQGVRALLDTLSDMLAEYGPEVHRHLLTLQLATSMYAFRWITLLFTQDFDFCDALRLWDVMLASPRSRTECLLRLCVACVLNISQELLQGDFATCMKMLQHYPPVDVRSITRLAAALPYGIADARAPSTPFAARTLSP